MLLEDPIYLFLFAPGSVPIIVPSLSPLSILKCLRDAVLEGGLVLDIIAG
jgi:hypothetical protein